jgi:hypothetical protein
MTPYILRKPPPQPQQRSDGPHGDGIEPFLSAAGPLAAAHVLIVAEHGLDLLCGLIRRGCVAATCLRSAAKADAPAYDLVLMPEIRDIPSFEHVIEVARHALLPSGRLVIGVNEPPAFGRLSVALARRLRLNGFRAIRTTAIPGQTVLQAELRPVRRQS